MIDKKMIKINQDLSSLTYDTGIEIEIIPKNFDCSHEFTMITSSQFYNIMLANNSPNKENILLTFLYINSFIGSRSKKYDGSNYDDAKDFPEAFYKSIDTMSKEISMSKETIYQCIDYLTSSSDEHSALLIKKETGSIQQDKNKPPQKIPNIFVLNKDGYNQEIEWALGKLLSFYGVDKFKKKTI